MIKRFFFKTLSSFLLLYLFLVSPTFAQETPPELPEAFPIVYKALEFIFSFMVIVTAAMVVYGAYMWMLSAGDPQKVKQAQGTLTWAIIGLVFFIMVRVFLDFILRLFGVELPDPGGTPF